MFCGIKYLEIIDIERSTSEGFAYMFENKNFNGKKK